MKRSEANVTAFVGEEFKKLSIDYKLEGDTINSAIDQSLLSNPSKQGGDGGGRPDLKFQFAYNDTTWFGIVENKSGKNKMERLDKNGLLDNRTKEGKPNYKAINGCAINGAYYYAQNCYKDTDYKHYFVIGVCGYEELDEYKTNISVYIIKPETGGDAVQYKTFSDFSFLSQDNLESTMDEVEKVHFTPEQHEALRNKKEEDISNALVKLNNQMRDEPMRIDAQWRINIVSAMILAGIGDKESNITSLKVDELVGSLEEDNTDADKILRKIKSLLNSRSMPSAKRDQILREFGRTLKNDARLYTKSKASETILRTLYREITQNILPFATNQMIDFSGAVYNEMTNWMPLADDETNDVVLTPRYIVDLMVALTRVDKNSYVWDFALGSGGFLISAMNTMLKDAKENMQNPDDYKTKVRNIKEKQLLGIELRSDIQILAILNMFLVGDGSSNILNSNSLEFDGHYAYPNTEKFPANVFLLNPPYSAPGNGMVFVKKALSMMSSGWAAVIIQDSAGSGKAKELNQDILKSNTLYASIKMPVDIFIGKSSVQTSIYLFQVGQPHAEKHMVKFIDFRNDGYKRSNRRKAAKEHNLRDIDNARERYKEIVELALYGKNYLDIFTEAEFVEDTIDPKSGADWNFEQHKKIDTRPTQADFEKTVADFLAWEVSQLIKNGFTFNQAGAKLKKD